MTNLTITKVEFKRAIHAAGLTSALVFLLYLLIATLPNPNSPLQLLYFIFRGIGIAASVTASLISLFTFWAWKWERLANAMGKPVLHGVWIGQLQSSFGPGTSVPMVFVIRQTYLTVSIQSLSGLREGHSKFEAFLRNDRTMDTRLGYVFETRALKPGKVILVSGAGDLRLLQKNTILDGTYWTNDQTHGSLRLKRMSPDIDGINTFSDAQTRWQSANSWTV